MTPNSVQAHVSQGFSEAVAALQWLEGYVNQKGEQVERSIARLEANAACAPPPVPHATARPERPDASKRAAPSFATNVS